MTTIKELRAATGLTQKAFGELLEIPKRSIEEWEGGRKSPRPYVIKLIEYRLVDLKLLP